jgi:hypothetical protein
MSTSKIGIDVEALAGAFLDDTVSLDDALEGLAEFTRLLLDDTHYDQKTGAMLDDEIGFAAGDDAAARTYLFGVDAEARTGGHLPISYHLSWAERLRRYGNTQLGGRDKVDRFLTRLRVEAQQRGEAPIHKIRKLDEAVKGGGRLAQFTASRTGAKMVGVATPQSGPRIKDILNALKLPLDVAGMTKGTDGNWYLYVNPAHAEEFAARLAERFPALADLAQAIHDVAPVWRVQAHVEAAPIQSTPAAATPTGAVYYNEAFQWDPAAPGTFKFVWSYDTFMRAKDAMNAAGIALTRATERAPGHPAANSRGEVYWMAADVGQAARIADVLQPYSPDLAEGIRTAARTWITSQPEVSEEAKWRAWSLLQRIQYLIDPEVRADKARMAVLLDQLGEVLPQLEGIEFGAVEGDVGAYGRWSLTASKGVKAVRAYIPYQHIGFRDAGRGAPDPATGKITRRRLASVSARQDSRGQWYNEWPIGKTAEVAQALDVVGNLPLAAGLRLAYLVDEMARTSDLRLEQLAAAKSADDIQDPAVRAEVNAIGDRIDAMIAPVTLYPFQRLGPVFAYYRGQDPGALGMRAYFGDAMGLGKTPQAITTLLLDQIVNVPAMTPALVVAPASVVFQWVDAVRLFSGGRFNPIEVTSNAIPVQVRYGDVCIVSEGSLRLLADDLISLGFRTLIVDEAHYFKNIASARTKAAIRLAHATPNVLYLSGTPLPNRTDDLWAQLHAIDSRVFPDYKHFVERYGSLNVKGDADKITKKGRRKQKIRLADDSEVLIDLPTIPPEELAAELADSVRTMVLRRVKSDVLKDLPSKTRQRVHVTLSPAERKVYADAEDKFQQIACANWLTRMALEAAKRVLRQEMTVPDAVRWANDQRGGGGDNPGTEVLQQLGVLRQTSGELKAPYALEWALRWKETQPDHPLIVFVAHLATAKTLATGATAQGLRAAVVDGTVAQAGRGPIFERFQRGEIDVLIGTSAMGTGVNLQRGADVLFAERWWRPSDEEQAEDRVYRIGQGRPVNIYYLHAPESIDAYMADIVSRKRDLAESIFKGEEVDQRPPPDPRTVVSALPAAWHAFATERLDVVVDAMGGGLAAVSTSDAAAMASVTARIVDKMRRTGACILTAGHVEQALRHLQASRTR